MGRANRYADCLLEGSGSIDLKDSNNEESSSSEATIRVTQQGQAVGYFHAASMRGHRGARSRLLNLLQDDGQKADGQFSDGSRQSYLQQQQQQQQQQQRGE